MAVRNGVLCRLHLTIINSWTVVGTVPSTDTWLIKSVYVYNNAAVSQQVFVGVWSADGTMRTFFLNTNVGNFNGANAQGFIAAGPGDTVQALITNSYVDVWVSGADLPGHI